MDSDDPRRKLSGMIDKYRFAMMTTRQSDLLRSRPMTTIKRDYDGSLWFFTKTDSELARSVQANPEVCLSYGNSDAADFVCVAGPAELVSDVAKKRELWNSAVQAWFPEGAASETAILVKVEPNHAEYWDSKASKLVRLFSMARAAVTGAPPTDIGEHRTVMT